MESGQCMFWLSLRQVLANTLHCYKLITLMMLCLILLTSGVLALHGIHPAPMLRLKNNAIEVILSVGTAVSSTCIRAISGTRTLVNTMRFHSLIYKHPLYKVAAVAYTHIAAESCCWDCRYSKRNTMTLSLHPRQGAVQSYFIGIKPANNSLHKAVISSSFM